MAKGPKVESDALVEAGLALMRQNGKELTKLPSKGRSMLYALPNGETVRMRTSNDRNLQVGADSADTDARLKIEGTTDWLLLVVPETERKPGNVIAYLLPTEEAVAEVRKSHQAWLATKPNTKRNNKNWIIYLGSNGPRTSNGYAEKWACYRLPSHTATAAVHVESAAEQTPTSGIRVQVEAARQKIAAAAGVPVDAVRITIDFGHAV